MGVQKLRSVDQMTTRFFRRLGLLAALLGMVMLPAPVQAWGAYGHRVTAQIALANVSPQTRARIAALLRAAPQLATPGCDLASLEDAAVWPDRKSKRLNSSH